MIEGARYVHTNLIARDWRLLSRFYQEVFGCKPVGEERRYSGRDLESGTTVQGAALEGIHLRVPGFGEDAPTLEIFSYSLHADGAKPAPNRPGWGHVAFSVQSVEEARKEVLRSGGQRVGDIVTLTTATGARVTWCYVTDPEGNVIELQSWS